MAIKRGLFAEADLLTEEEPVLAALTAASVHGSIPTGQRADKRLRRVLKDSATGVRTAPLCLLRGGFPCMRQRGSRSLTGWGWSSCAATLPDRPWRRGTCASSIASAFLCALNAVVGMARAISFTSRRRPSRTFWGPVAVTVDDQDRVYVVESNRHRFPGIQASINTQYAPISHPTG